MVQVPCSPKRKLSSAPRGDGVITGRKEDKKNERGAHAESAMALTSFSPRPSQHGGTPVGTQTEGGHQEVFPHYSFILPAATQEAQRPPYLQAVEAGAVSPTPSLAHPLLSKWKVLVLGILKGSSEGERAAN